MSTLLLQVKMGRNDPFATSLARRLRKMQLARSTLAVALVDLS